jgi:hypothetical protein
MAKVGIGWLIVLKSHKQAVLIKPTMILQIDSLSKLDTMKRLTVKEEDLRDRAESWRMNIVTWVEYPPDPARC